MVVVEGRTDAHVDGGWHATKVLKIEKEPRGYLVRLRLDVRFEGDGYVPARETEIDFYYPGEALFDLQWFARACGHGAACRHDGTLNRKKLIGRRPLVQLKRIQEPDGAMRVQILAAAWSRRF